MNTLVIPFTQNFIINRLVWLSAGLVIFAFVFYKFKFHQVLEGRTKKVKPIEKEHETITTTIFSYTSNLSFSAWHYVKLFFSISLYYFKIIVKEIPFIIITLLGLALMLSGSVNVGTIYRTVVYPVTGMLIESLNNNFALYIIIIIIFYSGELVWRERNLKMDQITDALPVPNGIILLSKNFSLILVIALLMFVLMLTGIGIQIKDGYFNFETGLYIKELFVHKLYSYSLIVILAMFIQTILKDKYIGHFVVILFYILVNMVFNQIGWEHNLYQYNGKPGYTYSDMNGFGHFLKGYTWFNIYWGIFAALLLIVTYLFWQRGNETGMKKRWYLVKQRFSGPIVMLTFLLIIGFIVTGSYIFYNTNILNEYQNRKDREKMSVEYEKKYKKYENYAQPKIIDVKAAVDIFPYERRLISKGTMILYNATKKSIDTVMINVNPELINNHIAVDGTSIPAIKDTIFGIYFYKLSKKMQPNDSIVLTYDLVMHPKGFPNSGSHTNLVYNGTFIPNFFICPRIGYLDESEMADKNDRKKYKLPPKSRMAAVNDSIGLQSTYLGKDGDWINFEAVVSTADDQIALAPGYLIKQWKQGNRIYSHFKMDSKILNLYAFISAKYKVKKDKWNDVALEVYYHKGHEYNIDRMFNSMKKSLEYFSTNFGPYQHKQLRIIEFPRYARFAQSLPNTIPYSESIGFIAKLNDEDKIDYVFYVTAHEIAHQWWAHQVIGGNTQGATVMSEALAQYSALMVMEKEFGKTQMQRFLKYELDRYLYGRKLESEKELPLYLNENQGYIHYSKGSLVMYALQDYIGEDSLNAALARYIKAVAYQQPPFTNSVEFLKYMRQATPDSLQYIITDMFENITLYSNKVNEASYRKINDSSYLVKLEVEAHKFIADSLGKETEIDFNDYIDIGVLGKEMKEGKQKDKALFVKKYKVKKGINTFEIMVKEEPKKAGIDVFNKLIDRVSDDNTRTVELKNA